MILNKLQVEEIIRCVEGAYNPEILECEDCSLHGLCIKEGCYLSLSETALYYMGEHEDQKARGNIAEHNAKTISEDRNKWIKAVKKWEDRANKTETENECLKEVISALEEDLINANMNLENAEKQAEKWEGVADKLCDICNYCRTTQREDLAKQAYEKAKEENLAR